MIADKSDAEVVPVRIEGLEQTPFSRLSKEQVRRKWFPKVKVTILEPVKLTVDPELKGRRRRQAAGAALYDIMSIWCSAPRRPTAPCSRRWSRPRTSTAATGVAVEDPLAGRADLQAAADRRVASSARKLMPLAPEGRAIGVMLPNANGAVVTILALMSAGRVPAMINFTAGAANILAACKAAQLDTIVTVARLHREGPARPRWSAALEPERQDRLSRGHPRARSRSPTRSRGLLQGQEAAGRRASPTTGPRSCSPRARRACRRASCSPTATCWRTPRRPPRASTSAARTRCSTCCRCSIRSG